MASGTCFVKTVIQHRHGYKAIAGVGCKRWECPHCGPRKRRKVAQKAASGRPERFITPTTNPQAFDTPEDAARALRRAWTTLMQEIRRKWPGVKHEYFSVFERTERGWPHLHILYRGCYIPQAWLSEKLRHYIDSPIVDIRKVGSKNHAIRYVTKYLSKSPQKMESCYRHSCSRAWRLDPEPHNPFAWKNYEGFIQVLDGSPDFYAFIFRTNRFTIEGRGSYFEARPPPSGGYIDPHFYER